MAEPTSVEILEKPVTESREFVVAKDTNEDSLNGLKWGKTYDVKTKAPGDDKNYDYLAKSFVLSEEDDEVGNMVDPVDRLPFKLGDTVIRLSRNDDGGVRTVAVRPESLAFMNPGITSDDFTPVQEGVVEDIE